MPRPTAVDTEDMTSEDETPTGATGVTRTRRPVPEGLTIGLLSEPVKADPGTMTGTPRTRATSELVTRTIEMCEAEPGEWFHIGNYGNQTVPKGIWQERGIKFSHRKHPDYDGFFMRFAMKPAQADSEE